MTAPLFAVTPLLAAAPPAGDRIPLYLIYPFISAALYALGSIFIKRAITDGARIRHVFHVTNFGVGLVTLPLIVLGAPETDWSRLYLPGLMAVCFFTAAWFTVEAMRHGDVSLVTPVMGTKVVFVALGSVIVLRESLPTALIVAAVLTASGIFILGLPDMMRRNVSLNSSIAYALISAAIFAGCDLLVQTYAPGFGRLAFIGLSSSGVALLSLLSIGLNRLRGDRSSWLPAGKPARWLWIGALLTGIQALMLGVCLATFGDATGINVVYSSRGLWAIGLVWLVGPFLGNMERSGMGRTYVWRVAGAAMLTVAIVLAVLARSA